MSESPLSPAEPEPQPARPRCGARHPDDPGHTCFLRPNHEGRHQSSVPTEGPPAWSEEEWSEVFNALRPPQLERMQRAQLDAEERELHALRAFERTQEAAQRIRAERDRLSEALRAMARRSVERRRKARTANRYQLDAMRDYKALLQKMCSATGVPFRHPARWDYGEVVEQVVAAALRARADQADERAEIARLRAELAQLRASAAQAAGQDQAAAMVAEFHEAFGEPFGHNTGRGNELRAKLHLEENRELVEALLDGDRTAIAHELADVVYVAYGSAHSLGIPLDAVIAEVHAANMRKMGPDGRPTLREDGKVLKPEGWQPADVAGVLARSAQSQGVAGDA